MSTSILSMFSKMLDPGVVGQLGSDLGESPASVSRGLGSIAATALAGLGQQASNPRGLQQIFDLFSSAPSLGTLGGFSGPGAQIAGSTAAQGSNITSRLLPMIFGSNSSGISSAIAEFAGLKSQSVTSLISLAIPAIAGIIGTKVRQENLDPAALGRTLVQEARSATEHVPAGLRPLVTGATATAAAVAAPAAARRWWPLLALAALLLIFWVGKSLRSGKTAEGIADNTADRMRSAAANLGAFVTRTLPGNVSLNIPSNGVEARLISFLQDSNANLGSETWFDFDRLTFESGSATLKPESQEQLRNVAAILNAYPQRKLKIGGYTDNTGDSQANLTLSRQRASAVVAQLVQLSVAPARLVPEGYGEQHPIADNATSEGRAQNRRISMRVIE